MKVSWQFACPICHTPLICTSDIARCPQDGQEYPKIEGIWRFLRPDRVTYFDRFIREYETVRQAEGRGSDNPAWYRALPFADPADPMASMWRERARSFLCLMQQVIRPQATVHASPLKILDLGAGNGWLSYRLAQAGHEPVAIDLTVNRFDGLGAHSHYDCAFVPVQAEFDYLPFVEEEADVVIFNASFHYTPSYENTLREVLRVLRPNGLVVVVDTAVYHNPESGQQMVREREAAFQQKYGFPSNAIPSENYLTYRRLDELSAQTGLHWQLYWPVPRWRWAVRRWRSRLRGRREPAQFPLIVGRRA
ncbi:MAG: methyltransferase domain-containing protein [Chloroflexi bacterium]|nr:MAG: methyltransferase domain-containing protein [Chloroflexota bacterium]